MSKRTQHWKRLYKKSLEVTNFLDKKTKQLCEENWKISRRLNDLAETILNICDLSIVNDVPKQIFVDNVPIGVAYVEISKTKDDSFGPSAISFDCLDHAGKIHILSQLHLYVEEHPEECSIGVHAVFHNNSKYSYFLDAKGMKYMKPEVLTKILHQITSNLVENIQKSIQ